LSFDLGSKPRNQHESSPDLPDRERGKGLVFTSKVHCKYGFNTPTLQGTLLLVTRNQHKKRVHTHQQICPRRTASSSAASLWNLSRTQIGLNAESSSIEEIRNQEDSSMSEMTTEILEQNIGKVVLVRLKGGKSLRGRLKGFDQHLNLVLEETEDTTALENQKKLGLIIVRGDNVVLISPPPR
jgi:small nuclear ribonucleoprotein